MPIVHVRATQKEQWLSAPFSPTPNVADIITEWQKPAWDSELLVYPPGYTGIITPDAWRRASNFLISIADSGESAVLLAQKGELPEDKTPSELIEAFKNSHPDGAIGVLNTVDQDNDNSLVAQLYTDRIVISGLIGHVKPDELKVLRTMFPESAPS